MIEQHYFDPGPTGIESRCQSNQMDYDTKHVAQCGYPLVHPVHFQRAEGCIGCLTGYDIGLPSSEVAYAYPECPEHGDTQDVPLTPEQEEMLPPDTCEHGSHPDDWCPECHPTCWCGGEVGPRTPGDDGLGCLAGINHVWEADDNNEEKTVSCAARKTDRYRGVHQCALEDLHGGYHQDEDGFMFTVGDEQGLRYRRVPWRAEQYLGATGAIRELVPVLGRSGHHPESGLEVEVILPDGREVPRAMFPGEWVVVFDDGTSEVFTRDGFDREIRQAVRA